MEKMMDKATNQKSGTLKIPKNEFDRMHMSSTGSMHELRNRMNCIDKYHVSS